ncbi:cytochrome P450 [Colletotrichum sublineola]|nr:cytochrome P450 [Colletotrichum sublineola]
MLSSLGNGVQGMSLVIAAPTVALVGVLAYLLGYAIYQLFLNPLRKFPGPKLWAMTNIPGYVPYARNFTSGHAHRTMLKLHQQYGPIVRVGPTHISINHPNAFEDLEGHRKAGGENPKDPIPNISFQDSILGSNREDHQRFRRALAHGFSAHGPVDVVKWFNYTTFDIIGDLSFGEPFGCLDDETYHP